MVNKAITNDTAVNVGNITDDFRETQQVNEPGTYDDGDEGTDLSQPEEKPKKTYFGDPTKYNFSISGIVRDKQTGEGLPFATVQVKGANKGVTTNMDGYFTLVKVPSDTSVLSVQYVGYQKMDVLSLRSKIKLIHLNLLEMVSTQIVLLSYLRVHAWIFHLNSIKK